MSRNITRSMMTIVALVMVATSLFGCTAAPATTQAPAATSAPAQPAATTAPAAKLAVGVVLPTLVNAGIVMARMKTFRKSITIPVLLAHFFGPSRREHSHIRRKR